VCTGISHVKCFGSDFLRLITFWSTGTVLRLSQGERKEKQPRLSLVDVLGSRRCSVLTEFGLGLHFQTYDIRTCLPINPSGDFLVEVPSWISVYSTDNCKLKLRAVAQATLGLSSDGDRASHRGRCWGPTATYPA
jgi:hypothetical protein